MGLRQYGIPTPVLSFSPHSHSAPCGFLQTATELGDLHGGPLDSHHFLTSTVIFLLGVLFGLSFPS